ncbi:hypothetical protein KXD96_28065 (plasmid) [Mycobacterium sp. SMC-2]|uniref:DUF7257 domain-containing protein n=1 Tax=Mycobacterium sp. SMC-2 TaxID=2857058 RepID=UPI0021B20493|nr:hypothetical protein [Mycobacterium sp. SMC-2]UXA06593.1 hypothetical protein KXD96_27920 [Mycobacterium sp. SMC-2]UXA09687.1 hypothetical protein KXD96_28065 [Mycobacterium sp. SMC-2]
MTIDYSSATSDPPAITPNPAIHNVPAADSRSVTPMGIIGRANNLSTGTATGVAGALVGGLSSGTDPFAALASFGQSALGAIANIAELILKTGAAVIDDVANFIVSAVQGVANIIGAIIQGLGGILGGTGSASDAQLVLQATAQTIAATNAQLQAMQAADSADSNNGVNVFINFSNGSLSGFTESFTGAATGLVINSAGYAQLVTSGNGVGLALHPTPTNTDDQIVSAVYYNAPGSYNFFNLTEGSGYNVLIGHSNAAMTRYVYAVISPVQYTIRNVVDGVDTVLANWLPAEPTFYAGAQYSLLCGFDGNSKPTYDIVVNGVSILHFTDTSGVTNTGADYRYCGFGLAEFAGMVPSQQASFGFVDDAPGPVIGDMFMVQNTNATVTTLANNIACVVAPANYFGTVAVQTSNYTYDPATNKLTVNKSAIYTVRITTQWVPKNGATYAYFGAGVFKNGLLYDFDVDCITSPGALPYYIEKGSVFIVQLDAGDYIQPGFVSYSNSASYENSIVGNGDAQFICAIANTGTAG